MASDSRRGTLLGGETLAAATLDRMLHHATTVNINGPSYRLKDKRRAGTLEAAERKESEDSLS